MIPVGLASDGQAEAPWNDGRDAGLIKNLSTDFRTQQPQTAPSNTLVSSRGLMSSGMEDLCAAGREEPFDELSLLPSGLRTGCRHATRRRKTEVLHATEVRQMKVQLDFTRCGETRSDARGGTGTSTTCSTMRSEMQSCGDNWITSWCFELAERISDFHSVGVKV